MRAASLKNIDKMMADGSHYDSFRQLPAVVGVDGVGVLEDGTRVCCGGPRPPYGTMAEKTVVPRAFWQPSEPRALIRTSSHLSTRQRLALLSVLTAGFYRNRPWYWRQTLTKPE